MEKLKEWIEPVLQKNDCRLYDLQWLVNERPPLLRISVERNDGTMDLDTCALCSEQISEVLDQADWFNAEYTLEVCSPGAERELKTEEQILAAVGSYVHCKFKNPKHGMDQVTGTLEQAGEESLVIQYLDKTRKKKATVERDNIALLRMAVKV